MGSASTPSTEVSGKMPTTKEIRKETSKIEGHGPKGQKEVYLAKRKGAFAKRHALSGGKQLMINGLARSG